MTTSNEQAAVSVVLVVHDQADSLERHLPQFLRVAEETGSCVIVVDDTSSDATPDVLKRFQADHPALYTTFLPKGVRNKSRLRLALTIGAKAAHGRRVVLTDIERPPLAAEWLAAMDKSSGVTLLYSSRKKDEVNVTLKHYECLEEAQPFVSKAERRSGRGHVGRWLKRWRGVYEAVAVDRDNVFDAIKWFDLDIRGLKLWRLRLRVYCGNML